MNTEQIFSAPPASPAQILLRREARSARQRELLETGCESLVSFTLNIPGAVKQFPLARDAFEEGLAQLRLFLGSSVLYEESVTLITGSEAFFTLSLPPEQAKEIAVSIETHHPLGRLFDMDVLAPSGRSLSRTEGALPRRRCLLCGQDAKICSRTRAHSTAELQQKIAEVLNGYFRDQAARRCAVQAARALLTEVSVTPKPGLVDRVNSGAHRDMDFFTFLDSSAALAPWFEQMFRTGWDGSGASAEELFSRLRFVGRQAEASMFRATNGVNTHKGLVFSLGLLCGAMGYVRAARLDTPSLNEVISLCGKMGQCSFRDFEGGRTDTNGLACYQNYRITGIRGEAANGFPSVVKIGLPALQKAYTSGHTTNDAAVITLLHLLAEVTDCNMIKRGGLAAEKACREQAKDILKQSEQRNFIQTIKQLDQQFIRENLSPGGCADLLCLTLMLYNSLQSGQLI